MTIKAAMPPCLRSLRRRLNAPWADERGIAVPTALMALVATFALASVAVISTVNVQQGTHRDHDSKEAIAAADAGASIALLRLNRFLPSYSATQRCLGPNGESQTPSAGWCPSTEPASIGGATYSYQVSEFTGSGTLDVISVGESGSVTRRVDVTMFSVNGKNVFADEKLIGESEIEFDGSSAKVETSIGTNGNIVNSGNSNPTICGNERHGTGKEAQPKPSCGKEVTESDRTLPPITLPENLATVNDNCRVAQNCTGSKAGLIDTYTKKNSTPWVEPRKIDVQSATLTIGGENYFVCKVTVGGSGAIVMQAGAHARIFVDTPEHCGMEAGAVQVEMTGNSVITASAFNPSQGLYDVPGIYMLGDGTVRLGGTSGTNEFMLYAPQSRVELFGNATYTGMIAGNTVQISGNPTMKSNSKIKEPEIFLQSLLQRSRYVECTGPGGSTPNADC